jgi:hypothetical protein
MERIENIRCKISVIDCGPCGAKQKCGTAQHNSGGIDGVSIMSDKFTTYLNRFEAFKKTGVIQDD